MLTRLHSGHHYFSTGDATIDLRCFLGSAQFQRFEECDEPRFVLQFRGESPLLCFVYSGQHKSIAEALDKRECFVTLAQDKKQFHQLLYTEVSIRTDDLSLVRQGIFGHTQCLLDVTCVVQNP